MKFICFCDKFEIWMLGLYDMNIGHSILEYQLRSIGRDGCLTNGFPRSSLDCSESCAQNRKKKKNLIF